MINETDEDILVIISMKDDRESSNQAFKEFHERFKKFIFGMAVKITSRQPSSIELRDAIFQNTLINVFQYSGSFDTKGETDSKKIRSRIHGWLVKIAERELLALLRDRQVIIDPEELNEFYEEEVDEDDNIPTYNDLIVSNALKLLKEQHQHVFLTYWLYYEKGEGSQAKNLPLEILEELATKYETTGENIRQIISRSKKKVFKYLKENYKTN